MPSTKNQHKNLSSSKTLLITSVLVLHVTFNFLENCIVRHINRVFLAAKQSYFAFLADPGIQQDPSDTLPVLEHWPDLLREPPCEKGNKGWRLIHTC